MKKIRLTFCIFTTLICFGCTVSDQIDATTTPFLYESFGRTSGDTIAHHTIDAINQEIYQIEGHFYGSKFIFDGTEYFLGESMSQNMELQLAPIGYNGGPVYSWQEVRGAAYGCTRFMAIRDGEPILLANLDGQAFYHDFDEDGKLEIVVSSIGSIPASVSILIWDEAEYGGIQSVDVSKALGAYSTRYEAGCIYAVMSEGDTLEAQYRFNGENFVRVD